MVFRTLQATTKLTFNMSLLRAFGSFPAHTKLALPNLSPTMSKGNIGKWLKKEGDSFKAGEAIADIETDKATVAFEMLEPGYLAKILVSEGAKDVPLGAIIAIMCEEKEDVPKFKDYTLDDVAQVKKDKPAEQKPVQAQQAVQETFKPVVEQPFGSRIFISPEAKKLADQNKINAATIKGTGANGRIILADIEEALGKSPSLNYKSKADFGNMKFAQSSQPVVAAPTPIKIEKPVAAVISEPVVAKQAKPQGKMMLGLPDYEDAMLTKYKTVTAERLTAAKQQVPHYYVTMDIEMDSLMTLRELLNKKATSKITINDMLIKACSIACLKVPLANSSWMGNAIRTYKDTDVSVAVQTPVGLITPIVYRANLKGLNQISKEMKELSAKAKENKLKPEEFMGGTFTISNAGMYGITNLIPIVNPPQSAILGVGATMKKVLPNEKDPKNPIRIGNVMQVALSCDHRVIDGATGSEYLRELKKIVENPDLMLL